MPRPGLRCRGTCPALRARNGHIRTMSNGLSGRWACPAVRAGMGHVRVGGQRWVGRGGCAEVGTQGWVRRGGAGLLAGCARTTARRRRRDLLGGHYKGKGDLDIGLPGTDGARTIDDGEQVAEGIGEAVVQPVSDNDSCSGYGIEQEILGPGLIHQFIVRRPARLLSSGWGIIGSEFDVPATWPVVLPGNCPGQLWRGKGRDLRNRAAVCGRQGQGMY